MLEINNYLSLTKASRKEHSHFLSVVYCVSFLGLGFSFLFLTSMVATTVYFCRWRTLAVGLASCGSGVGIFIYPLMARHILDLLDWQWCLRIQAGMLFLCVLLSLTYRTLTSEAKVEKPTMREALKSSFRLNLLKNPIFILLLIMASSSTIGKWYHSRLITIKVTQAPFTISTFWTFIFVSDLMRAVVFCTIQLFHPDLHILVP